MGWDTHAAGGEDRSGAGDDCNANLQMQLIEDLLDISRIIRGDLPLSFRLVEPIQVITAAIDAVQPSADTKDST